MEYWKGAVKYLKKKNLEPDPSKNIQFVNNDGTLRIRDILHILKSDNPDEIESLYKQARDVCDENYGRSIYFRGLIEVTNYCKNNCYYCGIRAQNKCINRYRLNKDQIRACCDTGYRIGLRTFVLQGGEDPFLETGMLADIVQDIRKKFPDCAITLSFGEKTREEYQTLFDAGVNRYLLRHETANNAHYGKLHPDQMSLSNRKKCLYILKEIGFQTGAGLMVGSPYQTWEMLIEDLCFLKELEPQMVGIGPFIPHKDTPFGNFKSGSVSLTLKMLALCRIILPKALIPATTALGSVDPSGREKAFGAGANVVMPNLSPLEIRKDYSLYDNKLYTGDEAGEYVASLADRIERAGYIPDFSRGDHS